VELTKSPIIFSQISYELLTNFSGNSCGLLMNFLPTSYEFLAIFLHISNGYLTNFLELLTNFLELLANFLELLKNFLLSSNQLIANCLKNFSIMSYKLVRSL
jgi:hypothetical protein